MTMHEFRCIQKNGLHKFQDQQTPSGNRTRLNFALLIHLNQKLTKEHDFNIRSIRYQCSTLMAINHTQLNIIPRQAKVIYKKAA
jgi:hypothetical protein